MNNKIQIYCKNTNAYQEFDIGISLLEVFRAMNPSLPWRLGGVKVNNKSRALTYQCYTSKDVEFLDMSDPSAMRSYVRSLCFVLSKAVNDLFPDGEIYIEHPVSKGYYCDLHIKEVLTEEIAERLKIRMQEIIQQDFPFETHCGQTDEVVKLFRMHKMEDKALLLETTGQVYATYNRLDGHIDHYYGALLPSTKWIYLFDLKKYNGGLLLQIPNMENPEELQPLIKQDKMLEVFNRLLSYQRAMNLSNVGDLNRANKAGHIPTLVKVSEALQEREIAKIADEIALKYRRGGARIILISGPSSSGKTTFCKRLQIQLIANALHPIGISLDDYYVNRVDTPLAESGEYDYESLYAVDLPLFNSDLKRFVNGEEIALPTYDFMIGERVYKGNKIQLKENTLLILEGIHALNPLLIPGVDSSLLYKIYVSALTTISLDDHNWIPTTDNRLIRRIVRDHQFRNYTAKETIARWKSVRKGEGKWIFPFQEEADIMFNSAMLYELAALRRYAELILSEISPNEDEYSEAYRLLKFLGYFNYIDPEELPKTSLLREFLGGSSFQY